MTTIKIEILHKLFEEQVSSTAVWVEQWQRCKGVNSAKRASMAIGKLAGIYSAMTYTGDVKKNIPEGIVNTMSMYADIWDRM